MMMNHLRPQRSAACEKGGPNTQVRIANTWESQICSEDPPTTAATFEANYIVPEHGPIVSFKGPSNDQGE